MSSEPCSSFEILLGKVSRPLRSLELLVPEPMSQSSSSAQARSPAQFDKRLSSTPVDASHFILRPPSPQLEPLLPPKNSILVRVCFTNLVQSGEEPISQSQPRARKDWGKVAVVARAVTDGRTRGTIKRCPLELQLAECVPGHFCAQAQRSVVDV